MAQGMALQLYSEYLYDVKLMQPTDILMKEIEILNKYKPNSSQEIDRVRKCTFGVKTEMAKPKTEKKAKTEKKFFAEIDYLSETYHLSGDYLRGDSGFEREFDTEKEMDDAMQNEDFEDCGDIGLCHMCDFETEPKKRFIAKLKNEKNRNTYLIFCSQECFDEYWSIEREDNPEDEVLYYKKDLKEILKPK